MNIEGDLKRDHLFFINLYTFSRFQLVKIVVDSLSDGP
jgi:hypothetical protein